MNTSCLCGFPHTNRTDHTGLAKAPSLRDPEDYSPGVGSKEKGFPLARFLGPGGKYPLAQRIEDKKRGIGRQKYPFVGMSPRTTLCLPLDQQYNYQRGP